MQICANCGFENSDNAKECKNCLTDIRWAKFNLLKFDGNASDTIKIGLEARKAREIANETEKDARNSMTKPITLGHGTAIGAVTGIITASFGILIPAVWMDLQANTQHPGAGAGWILFAAFLGPPIALVLGSISGAVGGLVGADISDLRTGQPSLLYAVIGGGIIGLAAGILPYIIIFFAQQ